MGNFFFYQTNSFLHFHNYSRSGCFSNSGVLSDPLLKVFPTKDKFNSSSTERRYRQNFVSLRGTFESSPVNFHR